MAWQDIIKTGKPTEMSITPKIALEMLERNTRNRTLNAAQVEWLAGELKAGRGVFDGSPIRFDANGVLLDGQHRLRAVVEAGSSLRTIVLGNLATEAMATIDTGRSRSLADVMAIEGNKNTAQLAALTRMVNAWNDKTGFDGTAYSMKVSNALGLEVANRFPEIADSVTWFGKHKGAEARMYVPVALMFCHWVLRRFGGETGEVWLTACVYGNKLDEADSRVVLRRSLLGSIGTTRGQKAKMAQIAMTIKAWNCHLTGKKMQLASYRTVDSFPIPRRPEEFQ